MASCAARFLRASAAAACALLLAPPVMAKPAPAPVTISLLPHVAHRIAHSLPLRIVAFGSSSTEGVGASGPDATYPVRLQAFLRAALPVPVAVANAGIGGQDADDMLRRIPTIAAWHADLVIWQTGSNDPLRGVPLDRFEQETRAGIAALRHAGSDVILMGPQDCAALRARPATPAYREALDRIAADMHVPLVRRYKLMHAWVAEGVLTPAQMLYRDGLHMTDGGYAQLATAVGRQILRLIGHVRPRYAEDGP